MKSEVRTKFHKKFHELQLGDTFHLVNTVMGGAVPGTPQFERIIDREYNAKNLNNNQLVVIRENALVELIKSNQ